MIMRTLNSNNTIKSGAGCLGTVIIEGNLNKSLNINANLEVKGNINGDVTALGYVKCDGVVRGTIKEYNFVDQYDVDLIVYGGAITFTGNINKVYNDDWDSMQTDNMVITSGCSHIKLDKFLYINDSKGNCGFLNGEDVIFTIGISNSISVVTPNCKWGIHNKGTIITPIRGDALSIYAIADDRGINNEGTLFINGNVSTTALGIDKDTNINIGCGIDNTGNLIIGSDRHMYVNLKAVGTAYGIINGHHGQVVINNCATVESTGKDCGFVTITEEWNNDDGSVGCGCLNVKKGGILITNGLDNCVHENVNNENDDGTINNIWEWGNKDDDVQESCEGLIWVDGIIEVNNSAKHTRLDPNMVGTGCIKVDGDVVFGKEPEVEDDGDD